MSTMSTNLKKAQEAYKACESAGQEAKKASERALRSEGRAKDELVTVRRELDDARKEAGRLQAEVEGLGVQLGEARRAVVVAEGQVSDNIIKARAFEAKAKEAEVEVSDARLQIKELRDRCSKSKQQWLEREEEVKELRVKLEEVTDELKSAQQNPVITSEVSNRIIEDFKSSEDFLHEVIEGSTDGFIKGFELCRNQVRGFFPDFDASQLREFSDDEEDDMDDFAEVEVGEILETQEKVAESDVATKTGAEDTFETPEEVAEAVATEDLPPLVERQGAGEAEEE